MTTHDEEPIKIGHVELTVDPTQISVDNIFHNTEAMPLRSNHPVGAVGGYSDLQITMSLVFPNASDINDKLRHLIALAKASPFTMLKSKHVAETLLLDANFSKEIELKKPNYPDVADSVFQEWANLVWVYYIATGVKSYVEKDPSIDAIWLLKEGLKRQYQELLDDLSAARITQDRSSAIGKDIAMRKWQWNYCLLVWRPPEDKSFPESATEAMVSDFLAKQGMNLGVEISSLPRQVAKASVIQVVDGDTVQVKLDGGGSLNVPAGTHGDVTYIRMAGYDAGETVPAVGIKPNGMLVNATSNYKTMPFLRGQETDMTEHKLGGRNFSLLCKERLVDLLPSGSPVTINVYDVDQYGRTVGTITNSSGINVNNQLLEEGLAVPYVVQKDEGAVTDISLLLSAQRAAATGAGLWNDDLWQGYTFKPSNRSTRPGYDVIGPSGMPPSGMEAILPKDTAGIILPADFRRLGKGSGYLFGVRYIDETRCPRASGNAIDGENYNPVSPLYFDLTPAESEISIDTDRVRVLWWDFFPGAVRRWMPSKLKVILDEAIRVRKAEESYRGQGPTYLFKHGIDALRNLARAKDQSSKKTGLDKRYFPGNYVPVCFESIQISSVQGLPDSLQATVTFTFFNSLPFAPIFGYMGSYRETKDNVTRTVPSPGTFELDAGRSVAFMDFLNTRYLTDTMDNSFTKRYVGIYPETEESRNILSEIRVEYKVERKTKKVEETRWPGEKVVERQLVDDSTSASEFAIITSGRSASEKYSVVIPSTFIQSVSVVYANLLPKTPMEGTEYPTAQFVGMAQGRAQVILSTQDHDAIQNLYYIKAKIQQAGRTAGRSRAMDSVITLNHPLLNLTGMTAFVIDGLQKTSDPQKPGWFNVVMDLSEASSEPWKGEQLGIVDIDHSDKVVEERIVDSLLDTLIYGDSDIQTALAVDLFGSPEVDKKTESLKTLAWDINARVMDSDYIPSNRKPAFLSLVPYLIVPNLDQPNSCVDFSKIDELQITLFRRIVDETAEDVWKYQRENTTDPKVYRETFKDFKARRGEAVGKWKRFIAEEILKIVPQDSADDREAILRDLQVIVTTLTRIMVIMYDIKGFAHLEELSQAKLIDINPEPGDKSYDMDFRFQAMAYSQDWYNSVFSACCNSTFSKYKSAVGQPDEGPLSPTRVITSKDPKASFWKSNVSRMYYSEGGKQYIHPFFAHNLWYQSLAPYYTGQLSSIFLETPKTEDRRPFFKWLIKAGLRFESYRAYILGLSVKYIPHMQSVITRRLLETNEDPLYDDLALPTYQDVYGQTNVDPIDTRMEIWGLATFYLTKLKALNVEIRSQAILYSLRPTSKDSVTKWEADIKAFIGFVDNPKFDVNDASESLKNPGAIQDHWTEVGTLIQRMLILFDRMDKEYKKDRKVPLGAFPTYRQLGVTGPHVLAEGDPARGETDRLEPGWFYFRPTTTIWSDAAASIEDPNLKNLVNAFAKPYDEQNGVVASDPLPTDTPSPIGAVNGELSTTRNGLFTSDPNTPADDIKPNANVENIVKSKALDHKVENKEPKSGTCPLVKPNGAKDPTAVSGSILVDKGLASSPAYPNARFGTSGEQEKLLRDTLKRKPDNVYDMRKAFPAARIYFVEEDKEEWGYWDDYYKYDSIVSIEVIQDKKDPALAVITLTNTSGTLTNSVDTGKLNNIPGEPVKTDDTTFINEPTPKPDSGPKPGDVIGTDGTLVAFNVKQGTRIIIKMGYLTKPQDLPIIFSGQVAEVMPGPIITIVCQAYDYQLMEPMYEHWSKAAHAFPQIIIDMLSKVHYFGGYRFYPDRLKGQKRTTAETGSGVASMRRWLETSHGDNLYVDHTGWWGNFCYSIWGDDWIVGGPKLENLMTMPRYKPNDVMAVRPYDGRCTLYFGPPDGVIMTTSRAQSALLLWDARRHELASASAAGLYKPLEGIDASNNSSLISDKIVREGSIKTEPNGSNAPETAWGVGEFVEGSRFITAERQTHPMYQNGLLTNKGSFDRSNFDNFYAPGERTKIDSLLSVIRKVPDDVVLALLHDFTVSEDVAIVPLGMGLFVLSYFEVESGKEVTVGDCISSTSHFNKRLPPDSRVYMYSSMTNYDEATRVARLLNSDSMRIVSKDGSLNTDQKASAKLAKEFVIDFLNALTATPNLGDARSAMLSGEKAYPANYIVIGMDGSQTDFLGSANRVWVDRIDLANLLKPGEETDNEWIKFVCVFIPYLASVQAIAGEAPETKLGQLMRSSEPINKLPPNVEPFRNHHLIMSGYNMISNQIKASKSHMGNVAVVESPKGEPSVKGDEEGQYLKMPKATYIHRCAPCHEDDIINIIPSYFYDLNAYHNGDCWQVAMSCLGEALREMYQGKLVIFGDPQIKPFDIINLIDNQNLMHGAFEVKRVVHHFSPDIGFITTIDPHLIVHVNQDTDYWRSVLFSGACMTATLGIAAGLAFASPLALPMLALGVGSAFASAGGLPTVGLLGFSMPWVSGQAPIGPSRMNPVRISPMMYKGAPYVIGLEGWLKYMDPASTIGTISGNVRHKLNMANEGVHKSIENWNKYMEAFWNVEEGIMNVPSALNSPKFL
jgi:endonuclease YncB( thermonuclease family)